MQEQLAVLGLLLEDPVNDPKTDAVAKSHLPYVSGNRDYSYNPFGLGSQDEGSESS